MKFERVLSQAEQQMQNLLENEEDKLNKFLCDDTIEHNAAKAYINFALAAHYALKGMAEND